MRARRRLRGPARCRAGWDRRLTGDLPRAAEHARSRAQAGGRDALPDQPCPSRPAESSRALERAAGRKVGDLFDCGFSHTACGRSFDTYPKRFGYASGTSWKLGENLAWGRRDKGSARRVLKAWLRSPPHRATMLDGSFEDIGIGLRRGRFNGSSNAAVWVLEIGCEAAELVQV